MTFDAVAYLASKGYRGRSASGGREMMFSCFFECGEPQDSRKKKLYVNVEEGVYSCKVCGSAGGSYALQRHFGDDPKSGTSDDAFTRRRILDWAAGVGAEMLQQRDDVLLYLINERGLDPQTIVDRKLGFVGEGWSLTGSLPEQFSREQLKQTGLVYKDGGRAGQDFFRSHLLIPIIVRGNVVQIRGRMWGEGRGSRYMSGPGEPVRAYNVDSLDAHDNVEEAILTEGEFDAMRLHEVLQASGDQRAVRIAVVGLPGTNAVPDDLEDRLSGLKRIFIGFDSDEPGRIAAEKMREKFGNRTRVLQLPSVDGRKCDWTEYLLPDRDGRTWQLEHPYAGHGAADVLRLMAEASGRRLSSVAEAGAAFRAFRAEHTAMLTGWHELDMAINPGLIPGQVVFLLAKTGVGKTLILCNLCFNMRHHRILFVSLEMTREEVYDRLARIYLFHNPQATVDELESALGNVWICDENRLGENDLRALAAEYEIEVGAPPELVFVDYLGYYARGMPGKSPYEKATNAAMQLKAEAKGSRFVVVSPAQVNRMSKDGKPLDLDDARDSGAIEETGDFVLAAYRPENAAVGDIVNAQPSYTMQLSVLKSRHGGVGRTVTLQMDALTLAIVESSHRLARRAIEHNRRSWAGVTYPELRAEETRPRQLLIPKAGQ